MSIVIYGIFFLSGAAALLFETLWFRQAGLALGNSVWASSVVLAGFMGGLAVGNGLAGRFGSRVARPVLLYAWLELAIGATGLALVLLIPKLGPLLAPLLRRVLDVPLAANAIRLGVAFPLLLVPSTAMGATLPLLVKQLSQVDHRFGRVLGRLYGSNTLGAVVGALAGDGALIAWFGIRGSALVAAALNVTAGLGAFGLALTLERAASPPQTAPQAVARAPLSVRALALLGAAFLCGGVLLALEVVWFRFLILFTLPDSVAFALMLAVVLAGIATGGLVAARWLSRRPGAHRFLPALAATSGLLCVAGYGGFDELARRLPVSLYVAWSGIVAFGLFLMLPVSLVSGVLFALTGEAVICEAPGETRAAGLLTLANTTGAMLGSLAGGFVLLPVLGIENSVRLLAGIYGVTALMFALAGRQPLRRGELAAFAVAGVALLAVLVPFFPRGLMKRRYLTYPIQSYVLGEQAKPVAFREGLTETIIYLRSEVLGETRHYRLVTNSYSMSSTSFYSQRYMRLFAYLPVAVHPAPRDALLISYGVGVTAKALTDTRELQRIEMVDVSRDILDLNRIVYPDPRDYPPADPRVIVHIEDGRHFLQTTDRHFDLITGEPPPPKAAGIVNLYTREFFALARERLAEGGILTYWLPTHALLPGEVKAILAGFCEVFNDCSLWSGSGLDWIMMGTRNARGPVSRERFERQWRDPVVAPWLRDLGFERPEQLGALFMAGPDDLLAMTRDVPPLEDDHPKRLGEQMLSPEVRAKLYRPWLDTATTRVRFEQSPLVARLWPPALREATLPYFDFQSLLNEYLLGGIVEGRRAVIDLRGVDRVLRTTRLTTLALWEMKTNVDLQRSAHIVWERGGRGPALEFELGAGALADRRYDTAAARFASAFQGLRSYRDALYYELYALCMANRIQEVHALAEHEGVSAGAEPGDRELWQFILERCALTS